MKAQFEIYIQEHSQLVKVQAFLTANPDICYRMSYNFSNSYSEAFNYIPNHEFISLCGSENLSRDGCISEKGAYDVLINYAKQHGLFYNSHIELNDYLRSVLKCSDLSMTLESIPGTFKRLFSVKE